MNLTFTPAETAFRAEVRAWMEANVPSSLLPSFDASRDTFSASRTFSAVCPIAM